MVRGQPRRDVARVRLHTDICAYTGEFYGEHDDGTVHSHEGGDEPHHHHEDGTTHDHEVRRVKLSLQCGLHLADQYSFYA